MKNVGTFKFLQRLEVWIQVKSSISLKKETQTTCAFNVNVY